MELIELLKTLGSAAGIAALITAGFNVWVQRAQHRRILELEALKKSSALEKFRYGKLYDALSEMQSWPSINYDLSNMQRVVSETTSRYTKVISLYSRISPLIDEVHKKAIHSLISDEENLSEKIIDHLYGEGDEAPLKLLLLKRREVEKSLLDVLSSSLSSLLFPTKAA